VKECWCWGRGGWREANKVIREEKVEGFLLILGPQDRGGFPFNPARLVAEVMITIIA
jgi:hypothetical protein